MDPKLVKQVSLINRSAALRVGKGIPADCWMRRKRTGPIVQIHLYEPFSHDVKSTILVSQDNKTAAILVSRYYLGDTWSTEENAGFMFRNGLSWSVLFWLMFFIAMITGICRTLAHPGEDLLSILFLFIASIILCSSFSSCVTAWAFAKLSTAIAKNTFSRVSGSNFVKD